MHPGPLPDTLSLRDEIARSLLEEAGERPAARGHTARASETSRSDDRRDRSDAVELLTGGGVPPERR